MHLMKMVFQLKDIASSSLFLMLTKKISKINRLLRDNFIRSIRM